MVNDQNVVVWNKKYQKHKAAIFAMQGIFASIAKISLAKLVKITRDSKNGKFR